jgi:predicted metal-dependent enzyme (double-stranded beta helix superfamily)
MNEIAGARKELVSACMNDIRRIISEEGVNRAALARVKDVLLSMTEHKDLFGESEYPAPKPEEFARIYLLSEDPGEVYSLYLVSALPPGKSPVHDHNTWAVIAGLDGAEENTIYKRLDDGSVEGKAIVEEDYKVVLGDGDGVAFMPEDIHSILNVSDIPTRHFHLYGKGFDQQKGRVAFNLEKGTTTPIATGMLPVDASRRVL